MRQSKSKAPFRVLMTGSREVLDWCQCAADAVKLSKWGLASTFKPRRIQRRDERGKWVAYKPGALS